LKEKGDFMMMYRKLGGTNLEISVICLGPMRWAAKGSGDDDKAKAGEMALRRALDAGVNFLHSSYEYGTRWMMGRVLKDHPKRSELHHIIKVPVPDFTDQDHFNPAKFRLRVEEALSDLHAERISLLQWMWRSDPNTDERRLPLLQNIIEEVVATFEEMRDEGKVGYLMTFPYTVPCARAALETGKLSGLIAYYNLVEMEMADLFDDLEKRQMGFVAIRPLYQGILTDEREGPIRAGDRFADEKYARDFAKRKQIAQTFREEIGTSMTRFAIRFALASPVVASVVVGLNTPEQVDGVVSALEGELPGPETVKKAQELWQSDFGLA
jgi:aryl-alcohol dehydrogenase-like predicted oxidoreductase